MLPMMKFKASIFLVLVPAVFLLFGVPSTAQQEDRTPETFFSEALKLYEEVAKGESDPEELKSVRDILDEIVSRFPASDLAVRILLQDKIEGLDVADLDRSLSKMHVTGQEATEADSGPNVDFTPTYVSPENKPQASDFSNLTSPENQNDGAVVPEAQQDQPNSKGETKTEKTFETTTARLGHEVITSIDSEDPLFSLRTEIGVCYAGDPQIDKETEVKIKFTLDKTGRLTGIPEHLSEGDADAGTRRLFLIAMVALEECAPFSERASSESYTATFDPLSVRSIWYLGASQQYPETETNSPESAELTLPSSEETEKALELSKSQRREIQHRLRLVGHDPGGADGIFGKNTREAISDWQSSADFSQSGFLNREQLERLNTASESAYAAWKAKQPKRQVKTKKRRRSSWYRRSDGMYCKRVLLGTWCQVARPR